jgi:hypothetical protein
MHECLMTSQKVLNSPRKESENHAFRFPRSKKPRMDFLRPYQRCAQINDRRCKSLICKESENDTFRFPWSKSPRMDFLRPYQCFIIPSFFLKNRTRWDIIDLQHGASCQAHQHTRHGVQHFSEHTITYGLSCPQSI